MGMEEHKEQGHHLKTFINKLSGQPESYIRKDRYVFGKTLGAGSFGIVRYARDNSTHEEVAVKIILKKALKGNEEMVLEELRLLLELLHPHIVGFRDWFESKDKFYIITQLATGGELFERIVQQGRFTEHDASLVIVEVLEAITYLHDKNIVHRDLKPENILYLTPDADSNVVLADFGIAKKLESPDEQLHSSAGSFGYAAPEVIIGSGHGKPCDIWSLGVITYTILCGYSPFRAENIHDFIEEVKHNNAVIFHADYWKDVSKDARRFIIKALQFDPEKRPTAEQLLNDPWLVEIAKNHKEADLLPAIKQRFDGKFKFKQVIELVKLNNKIKKLKQIQTDEDDDPSEINLFGDEGSLITEDRIDNLKTEKPDAFLNWNKFSQSLSSISSDTKGEKGKVKKDLTHNAFIQLVHTALKNKERVSNYEEAKKKESS